MISRASAKEGGGGSKCYVIKKFVNKIITIGEPNVTNLILSLNIRSRRPIESSTDTVSAGKCLKNNIFIYQSINKTIYIYTYAIE